MLREPGPRRCIGASDGDRADDGSVDVVLASLSLMYVIDRAAAAREIAGVLTPWRPLGGWAQSDTTNRTSLERHRDVGGSFGFRQNRTNAEYSPATSRSATLL